MAIDNSEVIDFMGIDNITNEVILTIADHLDWEDSNEHLLLLQSKLNAYISFFESGEIYETYAYTIGRQISIQVKGKYELPSEALIFYNNANQVLSDIGLKLTFEKL